MIIVFFWDITLKKVLSARCQNIWKKLSSPKDKALLKRLLGSLNWLKKYVKRYSQKTHDLYPLLRKDQEYIWESRLENAFKNIKDFLTTNPVIKLPTGLGQYSLFCEGSRTGLGATLLETVDGQSHLIGHASRATTSAEQKCSVTELKLSALAFALKAFRYLLYTPSPFNIYIDHYSIVHIMVGKSPPATKKIAGLVSQISEFNFNLFHVKGDVNSLADFLSRDPDFTNTSESFLEISNMVSDGVPQQPLLLCSARLVAKAARRAQEREQAAKATTQQSPKH